MTNKKTLENTHIENSIVTIGLPVHNGEETIKKTLDSIMTQTFTDFQLIISDNCSTDNTAKICEEYSNNKYKITYFRQKKKICTLENFKFILDSTNSKYFVWLAADDWWNPRFLEKNINILQKNKKIVGSISKIFNEDLDPKQKQQQGIKKIIKKILFPIGPTVLNPITGKFQNKVRFYLKNSSCNISYSVFRTNELKKGFINNIFLGSDWALNLTMLRFGDISVIDEKLMFRSSQGTSSRDIVSLSFDFNKKFYGKIFPWSPFTYWCIRNVGLKIFLKNLDYFFLLNYIGLTTQLKKLWLKLRNK